MRICRLDGLRERREIESYCNLAINLTKQIIQTVMIKEGVPINHSNNDVIKQMSTGIITTQS